MGQLIAGKEESWRLTCWDPLPYLELRGKLQNLRVQNIDRLIHYVQPEERIPRKLKKRKRIPLLWLDHQRLPQYTNLYTQTHIYTTQQKYTQHQKRCCHKLCATRSHNPPVVHIHFHKALVRLFIHTLMSGFLFYCNHTHTDSDQS